MHKRGCVNIPMSIIVAVQDKIMECPKFQKSPNVRNNAFSYVNLPIYQFLSLEIHLKTVKECPLDKLCLQSYKKNLKYNHFLSKNHHFFLWFLRYIVEKCFWNCYIEQKKEPKHWIPSLVSRQSNTICCMFCQVRQ